MNNRRQQQTIQFNQQRLEKIKDSWYYSSPSTLYSLCIDTLVRNINLILIKNQDTLNHKTRKHKHEFKLKYRLADQIGILPNCICQSLMKSYAQYYLERLGRIERAEFFQINKKFDSDLMQIDQTGSSERINLVTYYDLLLALATRPDRICLNHIDYRQCMWSSSTLEQRLRTRIQNELLSQTDSIQQLNSNYFRLYSAHDNSENKFVLKSVRAQQPPHLEDKQLKLILKHQSKRCEHLDLCPCLLTNKTVHLINKYLNKNLKYLRFQNCCDWEQKSNQTNNDMDINEEDEGDLYEDESELDDDLKSYVETFLTNYDDESLIENNLLEEDNTDDDTGEFDAYLEEYLNRYEKSNEMGETETERLEEHKNKRRRHHHHRHHRKHKRNKSERKRKIKTEDEDDDEMLDLELFLMSNNLARNDYTRYNLNSNKYKKNKKKNERTKCKLFKLDKEAKICRRSLRDRLNSILSKTSIKKMNYSMTESSKLKSSSSSASSSGGEGGPASSECDREANSLIKWLVKNTISSSAQQTQSQDTSQPPATAISLIEQIKQRAALLAETKMIDKVSISSSNYDETELTNTAKKADDLDEENTEYKLALNDYLYNENSSCSSSSCSFNNMNINNTQNDNRQSTGSSVYLSYDDDEQTCDSDTFKLNPAKTLPKKSVSSSSESSCTSCSGSFTSSTSSSSDYSDTDEKFQEANNSTPNKRFIRQQRLLDKVANLGSSPINVIQSIAAKALKFKLKNSVSFAQLAAQFSEQNKTNIEQSKIKKTSNLTTKYNRLLRQYKFFRSTHISNPNKPTTSKAAENSEPLESLLTKASTSKRFRETKDEQSESKQPASSNNLFSVFKYWMSKRATTETINSEDSKIDTKETCLKKLKSISDEPKNKFEMLLLLMDKKKQRNKLEKSLNQFTRSLQVEPLNLINLQHLSLRNLGSNVIDIKLLNSLFKNLSSLKILDISNCCQNQMFKMNPDQSVTGLLDGILSLKETLTHLIMADLNVDDIQANLKYLLRMKRVKHLDVSNCREKPPVNMYKNASLQLAKIVYHLDKITHLDISGTNLGGTSIFKELDEIEYIKKKLYEDLIDEFNDYQRVKFDEIKTIKSDVAGLMFLNNETKMLNFFGCFSCDNAVSSRAHLPAARIAGEDCEKNLYTSLEAYMNDRPLFILDALNHLFEAYRDELVEEKLLGGHLIMNTMEKNLDNSRIQISGSASLFYVLKYWKEENVQLPPFYLKRLIQTVINGMEEHIDEPAMRRNCVLIMCRLNLPDDVLFVSDRLIKILLKIFDDYIEDKNKNPTNDRQEHFVLRTAMHLLNILACSVHGNDKSLVGSLAIPVAMSLIKTKTRFKEADDILEVTWSFLWNITDETPENCKIFLDSCDGMSAFMECIQFKKSEITRNMMGLLGNVAEVKPLRNRLCKNDYIATFRQLLFYSNDGIEIPYNSAGVLVHIMSDGLDAWLASDCHNHERQLVIEDIETAIDKWDLKSERNINYRSFEPIFRLVNQFDSPICQRWACWALANLTTVYPDIYCVLFEKENGREILENIISNTHVNEAVKNFSRIVLKNVDKKLNN